MMVRPPVLHAQTRLVPEALNPRTKSFEHPPKNTRDRLWSEERRSARGRRFCLKFLIHNSPVTATTLLLSILSTTYLSTHTHISFYLLPNLFRRLWPGESGRSVDSTYVSGKNRKHHQKLLGDARRPLARRGRSQPRACFLEKSHGGGRSPNSVQRTQHQVRVVSPTCPAFQQSSAP